jgi:hypothetical protein
MRDWCIVPEKRRQKVTSVEWDVESVAHQLEEGRYRRDVGLREPFEEMGYTRRFYVGNEREGVGISVHCGCYSEFHSVPNVVLLQMPLKAIGLLSLRKPTRLFEILRVLAASWRAEFGSVFTSDLWDSLESVRARRGDLVEGYEKTVGVVTFVGRALGSLPSLPEPFVVHPIDELGWMIDATSVVSLDAVSQEGLSELAGLAEHLRAAGLLAFRKK